MGSNSGPIFHYSSLYLRDFSCKKFKNTILSIQDEDMNTQESTLDKIFTDWIKEGNCTQIDDLVVVGVKI